MRKKKTAPSFGERSASAAAKAGAALSVFALAASDLDEAAVEQAALASDIDAEIGRLYDHIDLLEADADSAAQAQEDYLQSADKIRALLGLN